MKKCDKCGAALNPTTGNCDECDGRDWGIVTTPKPVTPEPVEAKSVKKSKKK